MTTSYAFRFDAKFCSGCKACQAACKDKNNLPVGVLWRRVIEVSGGGWQKNGAAWESTVFAYNLSLSCNHCLHPKCAGICPVDAFVVREDGIVILDETRCMGCGYCAWGCPYGAPQYDPVTGRMTKCDFCLDNLEQGLPPACVAACPLRVLEHAEMFSLPAPTTNEIRLWEVAAEEHPYPLPIHSHTQPRLAIKQHPAMKNTDEKRLANQEEIQPCPPSAWEDVPLMAFTLLGQVAAGSVWAMAWVLPTLWNQMVLEPTILRVMPSLLVGVCLSAGMLASLAHLGDVKNAVRIFSNLRRSWLSREVVYTGLFGITWLVMFLSDITQQEILWEARVLAAIAGIGMVYSMSQVYRLPAAPGWDTWQTTAGFLVSALVLGMASLSSLLAYLSNRTGFSFPLMQWKLINFFIAILLLVQLALSYKASSPSLLKRTRPGLILASFALASVGAFQAELNIAWYSLLIFLVVACEEILGRWMFYRSRI